MNENSIISVLIGLVGVCETNPKTEYTDSLVIKALAFPLIYPNLDKPLTQEIIDEIRAEKNTLSPNCAACTSPCGNTSDYDMTQIDQAEDDIRNAKRQILSELQTLAFSIYNRQNPSSKLESEISFLYKALSFLRSDREKNVFFELLEEVKNQNKKFFNQKGI